jgi:hypothetical protein
MGRQDVTEHSEQRADGSRTLHQRVQPIKVVP